MDELQTQLQSWHDQLAALGTNIMAARPASDQNPTVYALLSDAATKLDDVTQSLGSAIMSLNV